MSPAAQNHPTENNITNQIGGTRLGLKQLNVIKTEPAIARHRNHVLDLCLGNEHAVNGSS